MRALSGVVDKIGVSVVRSLAIIMAGVENAKRKWRKIKRQIFLHFAPTGASSREVQDKVAPPANFCNLRLGGTLEPTVDR